MSGHNLGLKLKRQSVKIVIGRGLVRMQLKALCYTNAKNILLIRSSYPCRAVKKNIAKQKAV